MVADQKLLSELDESCDHKQSSSFKDAPFNNQTND